MWVGVKRNKELDKAAVERARVWQDGFRGFVLEVVQLDCSWKSRDPITIAAALR